MLLYKQETSLSSLYTRTKNYFSVVKEEKKSSHDSYLNFSPWPFLLSFAAEQRIYALPGKLSAFYERKAKSLYCFLLPLITFDRRRLTSAPLLCVPEHSNIDEQNIYSKEEEEREDLRPSSRLVQRDDISNATMMMMILLKFIFAIMFHPHERRRSAMKMSSGLSFIMCIHSLRIWQGKSFSLCWSYWLYCCCCYSCNFIEWKNEKKVKH